MRRSTEEAEDATRSEGRAAGWRSGDILRAVALGFGLFYGLKLLHAASPVVLIGFLGLLLGLALSALVDRLEHKRVPRSVTAVGTVVLVYGALIGGAILAAPLLRDQAGALRTNLPKAIDRVESQLAKFTGLFGAAASTPSQSASASEANSPPAAGAPPAAAPPAAADSSRDSTQRTSPDSASRQDASPRSAQGEPSGSSQGGALQKALGSRLSGLTGFVGPFLSSTASALAGIFIVTFIAIYIAIDPVTYREGTLHLVPRRRRQRVREVMQATTRVLQQWFAAQMLAMAVVGVITTIGLLILGIEGAFALGLIAAILEFVPFLGPFLAAVPAIAIALVDSPEKAVAVAILYLIIQQLESTLVTPLVMKNGLELPPILTILAQGIMGVVFGLLGVLVAVPLLAAIIVPIKMLYVQDVVGDPVPVFEKEKKEKKED
jgi:predicted PurR-regulated permease PerM